MNQLSFSVLLSCFSPRKFGSCKSFPFPPGTVLWLGDQSRVPLGTVPAKLRGPAVPTFCRPAHFLHEWCPVSAVDCIWLCWPSAAGDLVTGPYCRLFWQIGMSDFYEYAMILSGLYWSSWGLVYAFRFVQRMTAHTAEL